MQVSPVVSRSRWAITAADGASARNDTKAICHSRPSLSAKSRGAFVAPVMSLVIVACLILFEPKQIEEDGDNLKVRYYPTIVAGVAGLNFFVNLSVLMAGMAVSRSAFASVYRGWGLARCGWQHSGQGTSE